MRTVTFLTVGLSLACAGAAAERPQQVFKEASASVVVIHVSDAEGRLVALGSGVVVQPGTVVTSCHVAQAGRQLEVTYLKKTFAGHLRYAGTDQDLCQLDVPNLPGSPVSLADTTDLQLGQRVYAIGAPKGQELTISPGLIAALTYVDGQRLIRTTASISSGSSGGGLFDERGRLVGITTFYVESGQIVTYAFPSDLIAWIPEHARAETEAAISNLRREYDRRDETDASVRVPNGSGTGGQRTAAATALNQFKSFLGTQCGEAIKDAMNIEDRLESTESSRTPATDARTLIDSARGVINDRLNQCLAETAQTGVDASINHFVDAESKNLSFIASVQFMTGGTEGFPVGGAGEFPDDLGSVAPACQPFLESRFPQRLEDFENRYSPKPSGGESRDVSTLTDNQVMPYVDEAEPSVDAGLEVCAGQADNVGYKTVALRLLIDDLRLENLAWLAQMNANSAIIRATESSPSKVITVQAGPEHCTATVRNWGFEKTLDWDCY
jgi:Trypsin-like peptidase domain